MPRHVDVTPSGDGLRIGIAVARFNQAVTTPLLEGAIGALREHGVDVTAVTVPRSGGNAAIESNCYQCHTTAAESILSNATQVPNIETDFNLPRHMPIESVDQAAGTEVHDVVDSDLTETRANLGFGDLNRRHAECTDCHNPHRVQRNRLFNGSGATVAGTHDHDATEHSNIASGVLRGAWGVEPNYGSTSFQDLPISYTVKQGDGGEGASTTVTGGDITIRRSPIALGVAASLRVVEGGQATLVGASISQGKGTTVTIRIPRAPTQGAVTPPPSTLG